jgi:hypothetical protein
MIEDQAGNLSFDRIGGVERGFESTVIELPFTFWQYSGESYCSSIPSPSVSDQVIFNFIDQHVGWNYSADDIWEFYESYYYQAHAELGYPAVARDHIADLLETDAPDPEEGLPPEGSNPVFDPAVMPDIADWVATEGERLMFIYGEYDPWTGGAFELGSAEDSYIFVDPGGTHGAYIGTLEPNDQAQVLDIISRWAGVELTKSATDFVPDTPPPWKRVVPER